MVLESVNDGCQKTNLQRQTLICCDQNTQPSTTLSSYNLPQPNSPVRRSITRNSLKRCPTALNGMQKASVTFNNPNRARCHPTILNKTQHLLQTISNPGHSSSTLPAVYPPIRHDTPHAALHTLPLTMLRNPTTLS